MEFAGPTQKPKIIIETRNQPTRTKILSKKKCVLYVKVIRAKKNPTKFNPGATKTMGLKLSSKNPKKP
jgi:hypothetical protein